MQLPCADLKPLESEVTALGRRCISRLAWRRLSLGCLRQESALQTDPVQCPIRVTPQVHHRPVQTQGIEFEHAIQRVPGIDLQVQATQLQQRHIGAVQLLMEFQTLQTQMTRDRQFGRGVLPEIKANVHVQLPVCQSNRPGCRPIRQVGFDIEPFDLKAGLCASVRSKRGRFCIGVKAGAIELEGQPRMGGDLASTANVAQKRDVQTHIAQRVGDRFGFIPKLNATAKDLNVEQGQTGNTRPLGIPRRETCQNIVDVKTALPEVRQLQLRIAHQHSIGHGRP